MSILNNKKLLFQSILFGTIFGFLLQKSGVAQYPVLVGQLLLEDFTVVKVMLSAIFVGMIGIYLLNNYNKIELHIKPTKVMANIIGGLIFGVGFACAGYCPGTGAAALGQGDILAVYYMIGLVIGSYAFAEFSTVAKDSLKKWQNQGKLTFSTLLNLKTKTAVLLFSVVILTTLLGVQYF